MNCLMGDFLFKVRLSLRGLASALVSGLIVITDVLGRVSCCVLGVRIRNRPSRLNLWQALVAVGLNGS